MKKSDSFMGKPLRKQKRVESKWWPSLFFHEDVQRKVSIYLSGVRWMKTVDAEGYPPFLERFLSSTFLWIASQVYIFSSSLLVGTRNTFYRLMKNRLLAASCLLKLLLYLLIEVIQCLSHLTLTSTQFFWTRISGNFK